VSDLGIPLQVVPIRRSVFEARRGDVNAMSDDIAKDGVVIWSKPGDPIARIQALADAWPDAPAELAGGLARYVSDADDMAASDERRDLSTVDELIARDADDALRQAGIFQVNGTDPLGYDTSDFERYARQVAQDARVGKNEDAVEEELARIKRRFPGRQAVRVEDLTPGDIARIRDARVETGEPYNLEDIPDPGADEE
jgi:hypothetical protein